MFLVNLGCGSTFHQGWINFDLNPTERGVRHADLSKGIPLEENSCDAVYHAHVLEHLSKDQGRRFLSECFRVLKPGGLLRVVVPDLEGIVRNYVDTLGAARGGRREKDYEWILLELYDQTMRSSSGGEMATYLAQASAESRDFITRRIGMHASSVWEPRTSARESLTTRLARKSPAQMWRLLHSAFVKGIVLAIGGRAHFEALQEGLFRRSGEIHRAMYDSYSLGCVLAETGFADLKVCMASESRIPEFGTYELDVVGGRVRKPDSLFMEGIKPQAAQAGGESRP
jgi:predicted SAM-dependent methyltransferase